MQLSDWPFDTCNPIWNHVFWFHILFSIVTLTRHNQQSIEIFFSFVCFIFLSHGMCVHCAQFTYLKRKRKTEAKKLEVTAEVANFNYRFTKYYWQFINSMLFEFYTLFLMLFGFLHGLVGQHIGLIFVSYVKLLYADERSSSPYDLSKP